MTTMELTPVEVAVIRAVERINLRAIIQRTMLERMRHFVRRINERGLSPDEWVIVALEVDDANGRRFADLLMPGHDWEAVRREGPPWARGLTDRAEMTRLLAVGSEARREIADLDGIGVLAVGRGIATVFTIDELEEP